MNTTLFIAGLVILPVVGLLTWAWFAMARVQRELQSLDGFEGMHLELVP